MAEEAQIKILHQGVAIWNRWREENPEVLPNLSQADLRGLDLTGSNLRKVNLQMSYLRKATLRDSDLSWADLSASDLSRVDLSYANLLGANLTQADLSQTNLVGTNFEQAILTSSYVYGLSAWSLTGTIKDQANLVITPPGEPKITVDDLQVAQFVYLLLSRQNIRNVINIVTSKAVLILGRFTPERKGVLDFMANELRRYNLLPIIFDFDVPTSRDFTETIKTLAGLSLFIIADITNPKSSPLELQALVPDYQIPFVPIIQKGEQPFSMFRDLGKYDWMLKPLMEYSSIEQLRATFKKVILDRAWKKHQELQKRKSAQIEIQSIEEFIKDDNLIY